MTKNIRDARFRIAHITRDLMGTYHQRFGWLATDIVCADRRRVCIQYDGNDVFIDVPASEIAIVECQEQYASALAPTGGAS